MVGAVVVVEEEARGEASLEVVAGVLFPEPEGVFFPPRPELLRERVLPEGEPTLALSFLLVLGDLGGMMFSLSATKGFEKGRMQVAFSAVSYTHLTLPTTPYV